MVLWRRVGGDGYWWGESAWAVLGGDEQAGQVEQFLGQEWWDRAVFAAGPGHVPAVRGELDGADRGHHRAGQVPVSYGDEVVAGHGGPSPEHLRGAVPHQEGWVAHPCRGG